MADIFGFIRRLFGVGKPEEPREKVTEEAEEVKEETAEEKEKVE